MAKAQSGLYLLYCSRILGLHVTAVVSTVAAKQKAVGLNLLLCTAPLPVVFVEVGK